MIAGRRPDRGEKLAGKLGGAASFIRTDVSIEPDVKAMIDHAVDRLDCLVNNAGGSSQYAAIADVDLEQFDAVIGVHLRAVLAGMKYAARVMAMQGTGSVIKCCQCQWIPRRTGRILLFSREGGFDSLDALRSHGVGEKGIRVNSLSPGMIATGFRQVHGHGA